MPTPPSNTKGLYEAIGVRIKDVRRSRGLTQAALASSLFLSRTSLANIERGRQRILVHTLIEIANALGVAIAALIPTDAVKSSEKRPEHQALTDMTETDREFVTSVLTPSGGEYEDSKKTDP